MQFFESFCSFSNENLKNWEMVTVLAFYVDETINKMFIVFGWFLLAFVICKHQW